MKRFPSLRSHLRGIVLATAALSLSGCCGNVDQLEENRIVSLDPGSPAISDDLAACLEDDSACLALCESVLRKEGLEPMDVVFTECRVFEEQSGTEVHMTYYWPQECIGGRRPDGLCSGGQVPARSALAAYFADLAHLEAASVYAFAALARDLSRLGAPAALVERALFSAADEVRHASLSGALARRFGAAARLPEVGAPPAPSLEALARENAVEGLTRETYGALVATWQARFARDPEIRAAMSIIAADETRHAELSREIDAWAAPRLSRAACGRVAAARREAQRELLREPQDPPRALIQRAGLPSAQDARHLAASLFEARG